MNRVLTKYVSLDDEMCHGGALGADLLASMWAASNEVDCRRIPAQWRRYAGDRREGYRRNKKMYERFNPHIVIAFPGGDGTASMVRIAEKGGTRVVKIKEKK